MKRKGIYILIIGIALLLAAVFADLLAGKGYITLGPKSILFAIIGLVTAFTGFSLFRGRTLKYHLLALVLLTLLHLTGLLHGIPFTEIISPDPINTVDYSFHFYQAHAASNFFNTTGRLWGYDPHFMAGYPMGTVFDLNNKCHGLFTSLFSFLGTVAASKIFILFLLGLVPVLVYFSCRNAGLSEPEGLIGAGLAILLWYTDSLLRPNWLGGMFTNASVSYLSVFVLSLFIKYVNDNKTSTLIAAIIAGTFVFYMGTSIIVLLPPVAILFLLVLKKKQYKTARGIALWAVAVFILCSPWIIPFIRFMHYKIDSSHCFYANFLTLFQDFISGQGITPCSNMPRTLFARNLVIFTGIYGIILWIRGRQKEKYLPVALAAGFLLLLSYFGSSFKLTAGLQPYRFVLAMSFLLIIPSAKAIYSLYKHNKPGREFTLLFAILFIALLPFAAKGIIQYFESQPVSATLTVEDRQVLDWIRANTDNSARILYEDEYMERLPSLIPFYTKRQIIGGLYPKTFLKHGHTEFNTWSLLGKNLSAFTAQQLRAHLEHYNIKWVFCFTPRAVEFYDKYSFLTKLTRIGKIYVYETGVNSGFVLDGPGRVRADYNNIKVTGAAGDVTILKYHWLQTLRAEPELEIEEYRVLDDPVGFIKVYNGSTKDFRIYNGY